MAKPDKPRIVKIDSPIDAIILRSIAETKARGKLVTDHDTRLRSDEKPIIAKAVKRGRNHGTNS